MINIKYTNDPFFRYKMPTPTLTTTKNYTILLNLKKIAKSLKVPSECLVKWLRQDLHTKTVNKYNQLTLKGIFSIRAIINSIRTFNCNYVLCEFCGLPELKYIKVFREQKHLSEEKNFTPTMSEKCLSCGHIKSYEVKSPIRREIYNIISDSGNISSDVFMSEDLFDSNFTEDISYFFSKHNRNSSEDLIFSKSHLDGWSSPPKIELSEYVKKLVVYKIETEF